MTTLTGIGFGLGAALLQSLSYIFSRRYLQDGARGPMYLLSVSHVMMGLFSLVLLPLVWSPACPPLRELAIPVTAAAGFYAAAQIAAFAALRSVPASRVSPLLGTKLVVLAVLSILLLDERLGGLRWVAVGLCVASAFLLNEIGGRVPLRVVLGVALAVTGYGLSDVSIGRMMVVMAPVGAKAPWLGACLTYGLCGVAGAVTLCFAGWPSRATWIRVAPHAVTWFLGLCCLFSAFSMVGVVLGGIAQSTRGVISVALGAVIASWGHEHLEERIPRRVFARRLLAAGMMFSAIVLYALG